MSLDKARAHLALAHQQLERAITDSWEPTDTASCVTNLFYAYENVVVAVAEAHDIPWVKNHFKKAELAAEIAKTKILTKDVSSDMLRLNELRKDVAYGEPGPKLKGVDLDALVSDLTQMLVEVESVVEVGNNG